MNSNPDDSQLSAEQNTANPSNRPAKSWWLTVFRTIVALSVLIALFWTIKGSANQFNEQNFEFWKIDFFKIGLALASYVAALFLSCVFWKTVLNCLNCHAPLGKTIFAFYASQLGKYVPGKAMVVIIRTDMIRGKGTQTAPAAASVFVETLTWIFVGSVIACVLIVVEFNRHSALKWTAIALAVAAGVLTAPPIFRRIAAKLTKQPDTVFEKLNWRTLGIGWGLMSIGWCLNATSLYMIIDSIPGTNICWADYSLTLACVSLATVAGFASLLPGGLGVRELVMIPLLGPRFGVTTAVIAAVLIRLVWICAELLTSGIIYGLLRWLGRNSTDKA